MRTGYKRPTGYNFDGEPRLIMTANGTTIEVRGGQPVMDSGIESAVLVSLFTNPGWFGNYFLDKDFHVGDDDESFEDLISGNITASRFSQAEKVGKNRLKWMSEDRISSGTDIEVTNPSGIRVDVEITINRPDETEEKLMLRKYGGVWLRQGEDPASARLTEDGNG